MASSSLTQMISGLVGQLLMPGQPGLCQLLFFSSLFFAICNTLEGQSILAQITLSHACSRYIYTDSEVVLIVDESDNC